MKKNKKNIEIKRYEPDINCGLTKEQVQERNSLGLINNTKQSSGKSVLKIFMSNICTFFNLIWLVVLIALICVGAYKDLLFIIVILLNMTIAIIQEIKAKITVEKLSYVSSPKIIAIRDGVEEKVSATKLCLDEIIKLNMGNQIPTDCILLDGKVEVNESMLTGESLAVKKSAGDMLFAGSYIISGGCYARVEKVGKDSYIQTMASQAKQFKSPQSNLFKDINNLIKYIGLIIIPVAGLMFINNYFSCDSVGEAIAKTCGSITGMVPAGMFLLITIALSLGVIKLGKKRTLVQDIYSVEMLARTNVLCLDKTGTITDGTLRVCEHIDLKTKDGISNEEAIANILKVQRTYNQTSSALLMHYKKSNSLFLSYNIEFSSQRKYTATCFEGVGTYAIGAPEFLHVGTLDEELERKIYELTSSGKRVLMLAYSPEMITKDEIPYYMEPYAIISLEDHIREDAIETIKWFKENDVKIKIISGDNPYTVSNIAKRVGVENAEACISLDGISLKEVEKIADDFTVFGRVNPEQKYTLIKALKNLGYTVAMTGDGVNDSLALKEADCSIAMADGSEVARNLSNIVLLDSKFSALPSVVKEGRQVINNVQQSSTLFLMKTVFTILLSLVAILTRSAYPFTPSQMLLLEMFVIGMPSVILAIQPNTNLIKGDFISQVLKRSLPNGLLMLFNIIICIAINNMGYLSPGEYSTLTTIVLIATGFINLVYLCIPFNTLRIVCCSISAVCLIVSSFTLGRFFGITHYSLKVVLIFFTLIAISIPLHTFIPILSDIIYEKVKNVNNNLKVKKEIKKEIKQQKQEEKNSIKQLNKEEKEKIKQIKYENNLNKKEIKKKSKDRYKRIQNRIIRKGEIILKDTEDEE